MKRSEQLLMVTCGLVVTGSLVFVSLHAIRNPMHERLAVLETDMASVHYVPEEYVTNSNANYSAIVAGIVRKTAVWKELVAPPVKKVKPKPPPDLEKMLEGVIASRRVQIGRGDKLSIKISSPQNRRGKFMGVGDEVNKLRIMEISDESVLFRLKSGGKEYTYSLPRT